MLTCILILSLINKQTNKQYIYIYLAKADTPATTAQPAAPTDPAAPTSGKRGGNPFKKNKRAKG
jgi:hypothetical protein